MAVLLQPALRVRKDILLLLIGLVALIGGVMVYRSFADKKISTVSPGIVPAVQVNSGFAPAFTFWPVHTTHYQFVTKTGLRYCFWGRHDSGDAVTARVDQDGVRVAADITASEWPAANESLACFTAIANATATVSITFSGSGQVDTLHIDQPAP